MQRLLKLTQYLPLTILVTVGLFLLLSDVAFASEESWIPVKEWLWIFVVNVFGWLAGAAGWMLNYAINEFIIGFAALFYSDAGTPVGTIGPAVDLAWVTVRDIFNLGFIFGLIWIGFKMILNSDDSGTRRWLVYLIMAALLVNFSLFITKFVVDVANITAAQIAQNGFPDVQSGGDGVHLYGRHLPHAAVRGGQ